MSTPLEPTDPGTPETKLVLEWPDLFEMMHRDNAGRWYPDEGSVAEQYLGLHGYRSPSRAYPHSYSKPLLTRKFAKWLTEHHPAIARKYKLHMEEMPA